jgi:hypothetical protein
MPTTVEGEEVQTFTVAHRSGERSAAATAVRICLAVGPVEGFVGFVFVGFVFAVFGFAAAARPGAESTPMVVARMRIPGRKRTTGKITAPSADCCTALP